MAPLRITFMGTPAFAVPTLEALHEAKHQIVAVYTQPPRPAGRGHKEMLSPVHEYAQAHSMQVFTPESLKTPEAQVQIAAHKADVAVVAAYGLLLPEPVLQAYPMGCINVHPSLLPRWRGAAPIQRSVMAGDKETGIVIMQMDAGLDTGDMLLVERYTIAPGISAGELHDMLAQKAGALVLQALEGLQAGSISPVKQFETGITYAKKINKQEAHIDWNQPAKDIYHHILGLSPTPGGYFSYNGENIKIFEASFDLGAVSQPPGTVMDSQLNIACNPGWLRPLVLQRAGKNKMLAHELLRGYPILPGTLLN